MQKLMPLWFSLTVALLFTSCAGIPIHDHQFCSPLPGNLGAVCDNFLSANSIYLTQIEWIALQDQWRSAGQTVECTTSKSVGEIKGELEKLCSKVRCTYEMKQIIQGLGKIEELGMIPKQ